MLDDVKPEMNASSSLVSQPYHYSSRLLKDAELEFGGETASRTYTGLVGGTKGVFTVTHTASFLCCAKPLTRCGPYKHHVKKIGTE